MKRIAIIGAGLSGIVLGKKLSQKADVIIFEKSKGVGGRMSTRYADPFFDHGAQCFTAYTKDFQTFLNPFIQSGIIAEWKGQIVKLEAGKEMTQLLYHKSYFVAVPNMNSLCKGLAINLNIKTNCEIASLEMQNNRKWKLFTKEGEGLEDYDWVISTVASRILCEWGKRGGSVGNFLLLGAKKVIHRSRPLVLTPITKGRYHDKSKEKPSFSKCLRYIN